MDTYTGYHSKYWQFFQCYIIPLKKPLGFKVRSVLESSYHWLSNGHCNFVIITKNDRENWVSVIFGDNYKVSVPIGKLITRGFQNTPYS